MCKAEFVKNGLHYLFASGLIGDRQSFVLHICAQDPSKYLNYYLCVERKEYEQ